jgi:hypothetical protein
VSYDENPNDDSIFAANRINPAVRYRCRGRGCGHHGKEYLNPLSRAGCERCGSKRLEIWHPTKGHILVDWRSQKSLRKRRRRREAAARMLAWVVLVAVLVGCSPASDLTPENPAPGVARSPRPTPAPVITTDPAAASPAGATRYYLAIVEDLDRQAQIYRFEWAPAPDTCFTPIAYGIVHSTVSPTRAGGGLLTFTVDLQGAEGRVMIWRSHPWPGYENTPDPHHCLKPVREGP